MAERLLSKRTLIDKANSTVVIVVSVAAFVVIFSLVATKALASQAGYQGRVIAAKRDAVKQLKADIEAVSKLKKSYETFDSTTQNAIGGNPSGTGRQDGSNTKVVLDALPSNYDFPALTTSLEALLAEQRVKITNIAGVDDEVSQANNVSSTNPEPIKIPFQLSINGNYADIQKVVGAFEKSIRPLQFSTLDITGDKQNLTFSVGAQTYYQPAKSLNITTKVVK